MNGWIDIPYISNINDSSQCLKYQSVGIGKYTIIFPKSNKKHNNCIFDYTSNEGDDYYLRSENDSLNRKEFLVLKNNITNEMIQLNDKIVFEIEIDENGFYYSNSKYNIYAFGETQEEVENNLLEEFMIQYKAYALEKNENLDKNALKLKENLLSIYGGTNA